MLVAQELFSHCQGFAKKTLRLNQPALILNYDSQLGQRLGNQRVFFADGIRRQTQPFASDLFGFAQLALTPKVVGEVKVGFRQVLRLGRWIALAQSQRVTA